MAVKYLWLVFIPLVVANKFAIPKASEKYVQIHGLCSWYGHCLEGTQGTCHPGQTYIELSRSSTFQVLLEDAGCQVHNQGSCISGGIPIPIEEASDPNAEKMTIGTGSSICVWSKAGHPCKGCPASFRLYPERKTCYPVLSTRDGYHSTKENPCKKGQKFYQIDSKLGICDCLNEEDIYYPKTDECYRMNSQGPCNSGHWLILDPRREPRCMRTSCPTDGDHVFFGNPPNGKQGCYKLYSDEACLVDNRTRVGLVLRTELFPEKVQCSIPLVHRFPATCSPGSKRARLGLCKSSR